MSDRMTNCWATVLGMLSARSAVVATLTARVANLEVYGVSFGQRAQSISEKKHEVDLVAGSPDPALGVEKPLQPFGEFDAAGIKMRCGEEVATVV